MAGAWIEVVGGNHADGLTLNADGSWTGVVATMGTYMYNIEVTDTSGAVTPYTLTLNVTELPFTGFDSTTIIYVGLALFLLGVVGVLIVKRKEKLNSNMSTS